MQVRGAGARMREGRCGGAGASPGRPGRRARSPCRPPLRAEIRWRKPGERCQWATVVSGVMPATTPDPAPAARSRSSIRSLLRLWPYVRPIRGRLGASAVVGVVASSMGLLIPLVLKWLVDGPVTDRDPSGVWLGGGLVLLLGLLEAGLFGLRR